MKELQTFIDKAKSVGWHVFIRQNPHCSADSDTTMEITALTTDHRLLEIQGCREHDGMVHLTISEFILPEPKNSCDIADDGLFNRLQKR